MTQYLSWNLLFAIAMILMWEIHGLLTDQRKRKEANSKGELHKYTRNLSPIPTYLLLMLRPPDEYWRPDYHAT